LVFVSGCDKKASPETILQMDATTKIAVELSTQWNTRKSTIVAVKDDEAAILAIAVSDIGDTFGLIALGLSNYNDALLSKKRLSKNSAVKIRETVDTLNTMSLVVPQVLAKMKAVDAADDDAVAIWKELVKTNLGKLTAAFARLDELVKADLAVEKK
jgi:hypothetical protein